VPHDFKGDPKPTAAVRSCRCPTAPVRERRHYLRSPFTNAGAARAAIPEGSHAGPEPSRAAAFASTSGATHSVEAELTPRCAILRRVADRELSAPAIALPLAAVGPSSPLTSPLSPTQVAAHHAASSPTTCALPPHRSLPLSLRTGEAPHRCRLLLTSVRPPHLLPVCCLPWTHTTIARAAPCRHATRAPVSLSWAAARAPAWLGHEAMGHTRLSYPNGPCGTVPWAAARESACGLSSFFYFLNLIKSIQIQKFVQVWFELRKM
jgi:hypothetical protein